MEEENDQGKLINRDIGGAREGARHLGLIEASAGGDKLTPLGERVFAFGQSEHGSAEKALDAFRSLYKKRGWFIEQMPGWESITQEVLLAHPGISRLVTLMQDVHSDCDDDSPLPLPLLVQELYHQDSTFTRQSFIDEEYHDQLGEIDWKPPGSESPPEALWEKSLYRPSIVHQFKSLLYHAGILSTSGRTRASLEFATDEDQFLWGLTPAFLEDISVDWVETDQQEQPDVEEQTRDIQPPDRVETTTSRIIRNTQLVKALKEEYEYRCQICGGQRRRSADSYYAEGHHLHPLGEDGPDDRANIVIVCPNCHADLDYGMLTVDPDTRTISHRYDDDIDGR